MQEHLPVGVSMKSTYIAIVLLAAVLAISLGYWSMTGFVTREDSGNACEYTQLNYYYRPSCHFCQQVESDGSLEKLEELGITVNKYEVVNWGMYGIYATPTFEFAGQKVEGYRSFQELKGLLRCNA